MKTTFTSSMTLLRCLLVLSASNLLGTTALAQTKPATSIPDKETLSSIIGGISATVAGDFIIHFDGLPPGQKVFEVALDQGMSGTSTSTGSAPLSLLGSNSIYIRGARFGHEGDSNRAMIYDGECGGGAGGCSGKNDGGHLFHPGEGNLLIVSQNNDGNNPDNNYEGGRLFFDFGGFGSGAVDVTSLEVINTVGKGAVIELYADGKRLKKLPIPQSDNEGALSLIEIGTVGVDLMRVTARGQFALNNIAFTTP